MNNFEKIKKQHQIASSIHDELNSKVKNYNMDDMLNRIEGGIYNGQMSYYVDANDGTAMAEITRAMFEFCLLLANDKKETTHYLSHAMCHTFCFTIQNDFKFEVSIWMPFK